MNLIQQLKAWLHRQSTPATEETPRLQEIQLGELRLRDNERKDRSLRL